MKKFYLILADNGLIVQCLNIRFETEDLAIEHAERLSANDASVRYTILESQCELIVEKLQWHE